MFSALWGTASGQDVVIPELATPTTKEEYEKLAKEKLAYVMEELKKEFPPLSFADAGDRGMLLIQSGRGMEKEE